MTTRTAVFGTVALSLSLLGCGGSSSDTATPAGEATTISALPSATTPPEESSAPSTSVADTTAAASSGNAAVTFTAEVWVDNWFSLYVNGELVGEDSVPITTERSFNAESITFSATSPLTIAVVAKDYKASDSGLEYIGTDRQQMGDGGLIAQITDTARGEVVARTDDTWRGLVIHTAPTNTECESSANPDVDCQYVIVDEPAGWTEADFDDSAWVSATVHTEDEVGVKDGYETIDWDESAQLIWSGELKIDNTILWRTTVTTS